MVVGWRGRSGEIDCSSESVIMYMTQFLNSVFVHESFAWPASIGKKISLDDRHTQKNNDINSPKTTRDKTKTNPFYFFCNLLQKYN